MTLTTKNGVVTNSHDPRFVNVFFVEKQMAYPLQRTWGPRYRSDHGGKHVKKINEKSDIEVTWSPTYPKLDKVWCWTKFCSERTQLILRKPIFIKVWFLIFIFFYKTTKTMRPSKFVLQFFMWPRFFQVVTWMSLGHGLRTAGRDHKKSLSIISQGPWSRV